MRFKKVGVLMGGKSSEREVSLASGKAVANGLKRLGYEVCEIDAALDLDKQIRQSGIEAAFIALHGKLGEDGTVQGLLEIMGVPYTGSGVTASAVAMDKHLTKTVLNAAGIPLASGILLNQNTSFTLPKGWSFPVVVKPADDGSSVGVSIARTEEAFKIALQKAFEISKKVLIEKFVAGKEIQVAVLNNKVLGSIEIEPMGEFYDYKAKYTKGGAIHHLPARIEKATNEKCMEIAQNAYQALECFGLARIDLIVPPSESPIVLEVNTIPGMTELSLAPEIAAHAGMSFDELVSAVMESARLHSNPLPFSKSC